MEKQLFNRNTYTLQEIANILGITRERVRQIETQAIKKLRHPTFRKKWNEIIDSTQNIQKI